MKQAFQTSKSSVVEAIKAVGIKDIAKTAATSALQTAVQTAVTPSAKAASAPQSSVSISPPPLPPSPFPYYYPPYFSFPPTPREPFYPETRVGASRIDTIVPGKVAEADLHHIGRHPYPFYKQRWFIVLIIILIIVLIIGAVVGTILYYRHKDRNDPNVNVPAIPVV